jgi:hypothetical protein
MAHVQYASVVGNIIYVMVCTQPNIFHAVGVFRRYMLTHGKEHWIVFKRVFRYLCSTKDYVICYYGKPGGDSGKLHVHGFFQC